VLVAIHQPNFLPWLGYFDKIVRSDVFVLLDNVALPRTGSGYTNRVEIIAQGRRLWLTLPIARGEEMRRSIEHARIVGGPWRRKLLATIEQSYARAAAFEEVMPTIRRIFEHPDDRLAEFNIHALSAIGRLLGLDMTRLRRATTIESSGTGTDRLISIVRSVGGTGYLSGGGAGGYQEDEKFAAAGLELRYQNFSHPHYVQRGVATFVPGLSIVDALMNCGAAGTARLLGIHQPVSETAP
jgi:hypothetical protein